MVLQIKQSDEKVLVNRFNYTKDKLEKHINTYFRERDGIVRYNQPNIDQNLFEAINYLLSLIGNSPIFTQAEVIDEFISVLKKNNYNFSEKVIRERANKITLSILLLLNETYFNFNDTVGDCRITCTTNDITAESRDYLRLFGKFPYKRNDGTEVFIGFPIFITDLKFSDWCDRTIIPPFRREDKGYAIPIFDGVKINEEFKLSKINPS